ncbi:MAG: response regulator [Bacteroidetes bacterium]|nr:MAG: response regulator [Bacteroidota bacterium]
MKFCLKRLHTVFFLVLFCFQFCAAQQEVDSLLHVIDTAKTEKVKAQAYFHLAAYFIYNNTPKSIEFAQKGLQHARSKDCHCPRTEYSLLDVLAWGAAEVSDWQEAESAALEILEKETYFGVEDARTEALRILGFVHTEQLNYEKALDYYEQALEEAKKLNSVADIGAAYCDIARIYHKQKDVENAKKFYELAMTEQRKEGGHRFFLANIISNYIKLLDDPTTKLSLMDTCLAIYQEGGNVEYYADGLRDKGLIYRDDLKNYTKALALFREALSSTEENRGKAYTEGEMASAFFEMNQLDSAGFYGESALKTLKAEAGDPHVINKLTRLLARVYLKKRDFDAALQYFEASIIQSDSLYSEENKAQIAEFNARFENEQKEQEIVRQQLEIARREQTQNRILLVGGFLILLLLSIFQWYFNRQKRLKRESELALKLQKKEAENLRHLDNMKTKFFANISHELRTPLTLIMSPLEEALTKTKDAALKEELQLAHSNSKKLLNLVNEILDLSKLEAGKLQLNRSPVHLQSLARRIFFSFQSLAQLRRVELIFKNNLPEDLTLKLDNEKFEKILTNLISNAIKFSKSGGKVQLTLADERSADGRKLIVQVCDSGNGIPESDLEKVFDRYYQGRTGKLVGGTGIGLALSKELAQLFGGDLTAENVVESGAVCGAAFTLHIPLEESRPSRPVMPEEADEALDGKAKTRVVYQPVLQGDKKPRLLIVEDNLEMLQFLQKLLSARYDCHTAGDGREALEKLDTESFDLIISDVMMPEMDGFEFREALNQKKSGANIPFVMLTARSLESDKLRGFTLGVDDYITKPFSSKELLARIENLLRNKARREEWLKDMQGENPENDPPESAERQLLKQAEQIVLDNLDTSEFKVTDLARKMGYSQRQLTRIIKKLTGLSPVGFILEIRLQKARQFIERKQFLTVSEVRYEVGIESAAYFTTKFKERFGKSPKDMLSG